MGNGCLQSGQRVSPKWAKGVLKVAKSVLKVGKGCLQCGQRVSSSGQWVSSKWVMGVLEVGKGYPYSRRRVS